MEASHSEKMKIQSISNTPKRNLIWCFNPCSPDQEEIMKEIEKEFPSEKLFTFDREENFIKYVSETQVPDIFLITSDDMGEKLEAVIRDNQIIKSVFIISSEVENQKEWTKKYSKIKCLTNSPSEFKEKLISELFKETTTQNHLTFDMLSDLKLKASHFFNSKQSYDHFIYMDYISSLFNEERFSKEQSKDDFIKFCEENYFNYGRGEYENLLLLKNDKDNLEDEKNIILWYKKETFLNKFISNVFRSDDFYSLFKLRYVIYLLNTKLNEIKLEEKEIPSELYRGTKIQKKEFEMFKSNIGNSILMRGFVSTTSNFEAALKNYSNNDSEENCINVMFVIDVDKNKDISKIHPISECSASKYESEYLFNNKTLLKINAIEDTEKTKGFITVKCSLTEFESMCSVYDLITLDYKKTLDKVRNEAKYPNDNFYLLEIIKILKNDTLSLQILNDIKFEEELNKADDSLYNSYAIVYKNKGEYGKAIKYYEKSLKKTSETSEENHPEIAGIYDSIGGLFYDREEYERANYFYEKSLKIRLETFGENHPDTAVSYNNIAGVNDKKGEYERALQNYEKSLKIELATLGKNHPDLAVSYNNIGAAYNKKGEYENAIQNYEKSLKIYLSTLGTNHPDTSTSYLNIGGVYLNKGEFEKAIKYFQKSLKIYLSTLRENHPEKPGSYLNTLAVYNKTGDCENAIDHFQKSLKTELATLQNNHLSTANSYNNIGLVFHNKGEYDKAIEYYQKSLKIRLATLGENHPDTATCYNNIGIVYSKFDDDKAIEYLQLSLKTRLATLGENHPETAASYNNIAIIYKDKGEYAKSIKYYEKYLKITLSTLGENHPLTASCYNNIGGIYDHKGEYEKSIQNYEKSLKITLLTLGENHPSTATCFNNIATVYDHKGDYKRAIQNHEKCLKIRLATLGENHPETATCYNNIGAIYNKKGEYKKAIAYYEKSMKI